MNAPLDSNFVKGKLGVWCVDGITKIPIAINANEEVLIDTSSNISYTPNNIDPRDENFQGVLMAQGTNGLAYPVNVNINGCILVDSN